MHKAQAVADLSFELASVTTTERALEIINRALRRAGLQNATTIDDAQMNELIAAIGIEGGAIQEIAEQLAIHGIDSTTPDGTSAA
jgi:hypothetical protein